MSEKDIILRKIANTLIVYSYHMDENGLFTGKTGAMLYLYLFAEEYDSQTCYDFAAEILDGLMKSTQKAPASFEDGIAGLGWSVGRLIRSGIVDGNANTVLAGIDRQLVEAMMRERWSASWNELLYFADRIKDRPAPVDRHDLQELILTFIKWQLNGPTAGKLSEERNKAIRHYLKSYRAVYGMTKNISELWSKAGESTSEDSVAPRDLYPDKRSAMHDWIIKSIHQYFFGQRMPQIPDFHALGQYVDMTMEGLVPAELALAGGLAGLGTVILARRLHN